jgi:hypothetical protein
MSETGTVVPIQEVCIVDPPIKPKVRRKRQWSKKLVRLSVRLIGPVAWFLLRMLDRLLDHLEPHHFCP